MLNIITDSEDTSWLKYISDEFCCINQAKFRINVIPYTDEKQENGFNIYHLKAFHDGICIPNRTGALPNGKTRWLKKNLFISWGTDSGDARFACGYDIFWNAFIFLSRFEEYQTVKKGKKIKSYCFKHPRFDKTTFSIPIVNILFNEFEKIISEKFPSLEFKHKEKPVYELSHDVDYIEKTIKLRLKQTLFNGYNTFKSLRSNSEFKKNSLKTIHFLTKNPSYWCFDYWQKIEKDYNVRSTFYFYAATAKKQGLLPWIIDPSYNIKKNMRVSLKIKQLVSEGFDIGLHGSFLSAVDEDRLYQEKNLLEDVTNRQIRKVRQHWLHYVEDITPYLHEKYFDYDSTLGWNDRMGFRSGSASRYRPYDHIQQIAFKHQVTPQILMDSHIYDYGSGHVEEHMKNALTMLQSLAAFKKPHVSISWHQRVCSHDYGWHKAYEQILNRLNDSEYI